MLALIKIRYRVLLSQLLIVFYGLIIILALLAPADFIPAAFDSGGVTTGPITVPFIMAMGSGLAATGSKKNSSENSFGLVALCSIGPILSVLILSIVFKPESSASQTVIENVTNTREAFFVFLKAFPVYAMEVLEALLPLLAVFIVFQLISRRFHKHQILRILVGFLYTYIGLVAFLTGANVGFMPAGMLIGRELVNGEITNKWMTIPAGMLIGYFVVAAEPAVHVLKKQVEEVTSGAITQKSIQIGLSVGVALAIEGQSGMMVTMHRDTEELIYSIDYRGTRVDQVSNAVKAFPKEWITGEGTDIADEFLPYLIPLIQGESYPPMEDGLPRFLYRKQSV